MAVCSLFLFFFLQFSAVIVRSDHYLANLLKDRVGLKNAVGRN